MDLSDLVKDIFGTETLIGFRVSPNETFDIRDHRLARRRIEMLMTFMELKWELYHYKEHRVISYYFYKIEGNHTLREIKDGFTPKLGTDYWAAKRWFNIEILPWKRSDKPNLHHDKSPYHFFLCYHPLLKTKKWYLCNSNN